MKRIWTVLITLALLIALIAGCTPSTTTPAVMTTTVATTTKGTTTTQATTTEASLINYDSMFPVTNENVELEFCIRYSPDVVGKWEKLWFYNWMEEKTNVTVVPRMVANDVWAEQKMIMLTSGDLPDVYFTGGWDNSEVYKYGLQDKVFIQITDYINNTSLMPNLNAAFDMERFATGKAISTLPDGNIYGLPTMMSEYYVTASGIRAHWVNDHLVNAGIDWKTIKTLNDFYQALVAVRDGDYNKNGTADEIGWSSYWGTDGSTGMKYVLAYILNAYGVITNDSEIAINYNTQEAGYAPMMDEYKDAVSFLNKLYTEKLLDNDLFSQVEADMAAKYAAEQVGFATYWNPGITGSAAQWERHSATYDTNSVLSSQTPLVDKAGDTPMTWSSSKIRPNQFIVTKNCQYPEVAMRWADACYDPVISTYYRIGPEYGSADDTFGVGWVYVEETTFHDSWAQALKDFGEDYTGWQYIQMHVSSAASVGYFGMDEMLGLRVLYPDFNSKAVPQWTFPYESYIQPYEVLGFPSVYYSAEDTKTIELYKLPLNEYVVQMTAKFIAGEESLDNWDNFQAQLEALNAKEYNDVLKNAYANYLAKLN